MLNARNPMFLWWGPDLIQFYNDAYRPSLGLKGRHPEALGACGRPFWHDIWNVIGPEVEMVMSTGNSTWHEDAFIPIERDGGLADVWWTYGYSPAFDGDGSIAGTLVICHETTARVVSERERDQVVRALATERGRLAAIFDQAPSTLAVFRGDDHVYDRINPAYRKVIGGRDVIGKPLLDAFPGLRAQGFGEQLDKVRATGIAYIGKDLPFRYAAHAASTPETRFFDLVIQRLTEADGSQTLVAHGIEVTDQVVAVKALRESEQRLRDQFAKLPIGTVLWELAGEDFVLIAVNDAMEAIAPGLGGRIGTLRSVIFPNAEGIAADYHRCLREHMVIKRSEYRDFGSLGPRHLEFSIGPQLPNRVLVHVVDVTEKTVLEARFRNAQRMESVGLLAGGIAHDFNNLMTVIGAHNELLLEEIRAGSPNQSHIEAIGDATARASHLTRQLLAFGRKQIMQPTYVNANDVVESLAGMLRGALGADIAIEMTLGEDSGIICIDVSQLEQAIMNLVFNAADAMPQGGTLTIRTNRLSIAPGQADTGEIVSPGDYLCIEVRDTGIGMDASLRERAFEPFFTTKDLAAGRGMGLATVYGIAKQSDGYVTLESVPGQGTTARLLFPVAVPKESARHTATVSPATPSVRGGNHESILLIEDEAGVRMVAKRVLTNAGYKVFDAASGAAGLKLSEDITAPLHVVLSDVVMPGMGGAEVVERVRARRPGIRAAVMSGYTDDEVMRRGIGESSVAFLRKPFTAAQLTRFVRELLDSQPQETATSGSPAEAAGELA